MGRRQSHRNAARPCVTGFVHVCGRSGRAVAVSGHFSQSHEFIGVLSGEARAVTGLWRENGLRPAGPALKKCDPRRARWKMKFL